LVEFATASARRWVRVAYVMPTAARASVRMLVLCERPRRGHSDYPVRSTGLLGDTDEQDASEGVCEGGDRFNGVVTPLLLEVDEVPLFKAVLRWLRDPSELFDGGVQI
jgi:hypothetical protein